MVKTYSYARLTSITYEFSAYDVQIALIDYYKIEAGIGRKVELDIREEDGETNDPAKVYLRVTISEPDTMNPQEKKKSNSL